MIIVAIGANDGQDFLDGEKPLKFGSDAWISVYQQRTEQFLAMLTANGAHVVWIGLPPMKAAGYNSRIDLINRISLSVVSANPNAVWWNPAPYIGDDKGQYREFARAARWQGATPPRPGRDSHVVGRSRVAVSVTAELAECNARGCSEPVTLRPRRNQNGPTAHPVNLSARN